jgi:hypothetical protein
MEPVLNDIAASILSPLGEDTWMWADDVLSELSRDDFEFVNNILLHDSWELFMSGMGLNSYERWCLVWETMATRIYAGTLLS